MGFFWDFLKKKFWKGWKFLKTNVIFVISDPENPLGEILRIYALAFFSPFNSPNSLVAPINSNFVPPRQDLRLFQFKNVKNFVPRSGLDHFTSLTVTSKRPYFYAKNGIGWSSRVGGRAENGPGPGSGPGPAFRPAGRAGPNWAGPAWLIRLA